MRRLMHFSRSRMTAVRFTIGTNRRIMSRGLTIELLDPNRIDQAFPLARLAVPGLDLDAWRRFASAATIAAPFEIPRIAIIAAANLRGYLQGLCIYRIEPDLEHGASLSIEHFVALDLIDSAHVADELVRALEQEGRRHGCRAMKTHLPQDLGDASAGARQLFRILRRHGEESAARHLLATIA